jgi:hypothetical protein
MAAIATVDTMPLICATFCLSTPTQPVDRDDADAR